MEAGHSDPEKLKDAALDIERLSSQDLKQRQMEIKVRFVFLPGKNSASVYFMLLNCEVVLQFLLLASSYSIEVFTSYSAVISSENCLFPILS